VAAAAAAGGPTDAASDDRRPAREGAAAADAAETAWGSGTDSGCETGVGELKGGSGIHSSRFALPGPPPPPVIPRRGVDGIICCPYPAGTLPGPPPAPPAIS
ncbi:hypothetical protein PMAYCL1PPCAC_20174, partial [Pristionchus mayeri]